MPGDAVHFASFAFGESPHSTVPFSSGEVICNNTSGIETMERERERGRGRKETPVVASFGGEKKKKSRNPTREARMLRAVTASGLPELGGRCHTEPQNAVQGQ